MTKPAATDFYALLNWKLLAGSHDFPGPDGGTCINEAAIIAAGFEYKKVMSARDCPPCFSRVIAAYAIGLNDRMPDDLRQELLIPFVTRLAGTADSGEVEAARVRLIGYRVCRDLLAPLAEKMGLTTEAARLRDLAYLTHSRARTRALLQTVFQHPKVKKADADAFAFAFADAFAFAFADADADAFAFAFAFAFADADAVAFAFADADAVAFAEAFAERRRIWSLATDILDEAIRLGNHADAIDHALVVERMAAVRNAEAARAKVSA